MAKEITRRMFAALSATRKCSPVLGSLRENVNKKGCATTVADLLNTPDVCGVESRYLNVTTPAGPDGKWCPPVSDLPENYNFVVPLHMREAVKADKEKNRLDLLPVAPLEEVGKVFTYGAAKYSDRNWEKGFEYHRPYGACLRHILAWWRGEDTDPESGISHLAHAICNLLFLLEFELKNTGKDDRPNHA